MDCPKALKISNLVKNYGSHSAVKDISLDISPGEIFGFLGMNGAGKTTTLKMIVGLLKPTKGEIEIFGNNASIHTQESKSICGYIPDRPYIYPKLTAREFLLFISELYKVPYKIAKNRITELLDHFQLLDKQNQMIESFSHGMKQRVATAASLIHHPKLLIIDEPMVGLDPHGAKLLKETLRTFSSEGNSVFLSTHSLDVAQDVCDRLAIIHHGSIIATGTFDELRAQGNSNAARLEEVFLEITSEVSE